MTRLSARPAADPRISVLFVLPSLQGGGAERVAATLLRHIDSARFKLALAVLDGSNPVFARDLPPDLEFIDLGCRRVRYAAFSLLRLIWQKKPDVVFSMIGHLNMALAFLKPFFPSNVRLLARETSVLSARLDAEPGGALWRLGYQWLYRRLDIVVSQSDATAHELIEDIGMAPERVRVIRNPLDAKRIRVLAQEPLAEIPWGAHPLPLVAAGRLTHVKGFDLLLESIALLADPRVHLTILGEGPLRSELEALTHDLGIAPQVRFMGFQRNPYQYFARAKSFVLSSRFEQFPNVVLEALACGIPVVATPARGGIHEIARGEPNVILADDVSAPSLARALAAHLDDDCRSRGAADLAAYAVARIASLFEAMFEETGAGNETHLPSRTR